MYTVHAQWQHEQDSEYSELAQAVEEAEAILWRHPEAVITIRADRLIVHFMYSATKEKA